MEKKEDHFLLSPFFFFFFLIRKNWFCFFGSTKITTSGSKNQMGGWSVLEL